VISDAGPIGSANIGSACGIFDAEGRVLLVHHTYGRHNWEIPGGIALPGESPMDAARRELEEETSIRADDGELTGVYFEPGHDFGPMLHFVFRFQAPLERPEPQPPEIDGLGWFPIEDLPSPISDFTERRIRDALLERGVFAVVSGRQWRE